MIIVDLSNPEQYTPVLREVATHPEIDGIVTRGRRLSFPDTAKILDINFWGTVNVVEALRGNLGEGGAWWSLAQLHRSTSRNW